MGWRLKSGLTKTQVYELVKDHIPSNIFLPSIRKCEFKKCRASYWFEYYDDDYRYHLYFSNWCGQSKIRLERLEYVETDDCYCVEKLFFVEVSFDYLLEHGYLREVA